MTGPRVKVKGFFYTQQLRSKGRMAFIEDQLKLVMTGHLGVYSVGAGVWANVQAMNFFMCKMNFKNYKRLELNE